MLFNRTSYNFSNKINLKSKSLKNNIIIITYTYLLNKYLIMKQKFLFF